MENRTWFHHFLHRICTQSLQISLASPGATLQWPVIILAIILRFLSYSSWLHIHFLLHDERKDKTGNNNAVKPETFVQRLRKEDPLLFEFSFGASSASAVSEAGPIESHPTFSWVLRGLEETSSNHRKARSIRLHWCRQCHHKPKNSFNSNLSTVVKPHEYLLSRWALFIMSVDVRDGQNDYSQSASEGIITPLISNFKNWKFYSECKK